MVQTDRSEQILIAWHGMCPPPNTHPIVRGGNIIVCRSLIGDNTQQSTERHTAALIKFLVKSIQIPKESTIVDINSHFGTF